VLVVSLTGGIGAGKSAVSDRFAALGIKVVDADVASREVVKPGSFALERIRERFGEAVIASDGTLDRTALRRVVFDDAEARTWLERLLHPRIGEYMRTETLRATSPYVVVVSPLLVENRRPRRAPGRILVVDAPEAAQLERTMRRDGDDESRVRAIMATQASRAERLARADDVIVNDGDLAELDRAVLELHGRYLALAESLAHA